ncbi:hypothetical protein T492DRAFT_960397 [Pavlovales sp. CCMP2436]|nr:hypothetical protein T492DRAFT_960397 [Pavlovales sp. CCMP2436]
MKRSADGEGGKDEGGRRKDRFKDGFRFSDVDGLSGLQWLAERARRRDGHSGGSEAPASWRLEASSVPRSALKQSSLLKFFAPPAAPLAAECEASPAAADAAATAADDSTTPWWFEHGGAYAQELKSHLALALRRDSKLLTAAEHGWIRAFLELPVPASALYARLYMRKPSAFRLNRLQYKEVGDEDGHALAARELAAAKLVVLVADFRTPATTSAATSGGNGALADTACDVDGEALRLALGVLTKEELRKLAKSAGVNCKGASGRWRADEALTRELCMRLGLRDVQLAAAPGPATVGEAQSAAGSAAASPYGSGMAEAGRGATITLRPAEARAILEKLMEMTRGPVLLLRAPPLEAIGRAMRLIDGVGGDGSSSVRTAVVAEMGVFRFPSYRTWAQVLDCASAEVAHEAAQLPTAAAAPAPAASASTVAPCTAAAIAASAPASSFAAAASAPASSFAAATSAPASSFAAATSAPASSFAAATSAPASSFAAAASAPVSAAARAPLEEVVKLPAAAPAAASASASASAASQPVSAPAPASLSLSVSVSAPASLSLLLPAAAPSTSVSVTAPSASVSVAAPVSASTPACHAAFASRAALDRHEAACSLALRYEQNILPRDNRYLGEINNSNSNNYRPSTAAELEVCDALAASAAASLRALARRCALRQSALGQSDCQPVKSDSQPVRQSGRLVLTASPDTDAEIGGTVGPSASITPLVVLPEDGCAALGVRALSLALAKAAATLPADGGADATASRTQRQGEGVEEEEEVEEGVVVKEEEGVVEVEVTEAEGWAALRAARPSVAGLSGGCALAALLGVHAGVLARRQLSSQAAETVALLLLSPFGASRRGHWWSRLAIDG